MATQQYDRYSDNVSRQPETRRALARHVAVYDRDNPTSLGGMAFDVATEERCRNILVRYCAHVPRNYQYRDGVQVVFLILRDHLGDDNLGVAGGVLYELIEVDCSYSDDPGAGFQRWKYDHLHRHADFELPHVPHLTTVTSAIKPSSALLRWRWTHPARYPVRLSDCGPASQHGSVDPGCLRHRKAWTIEHTMYVSTRDGGTSVFRGVSPQRFHRAHWNLESTHVGRFIGEKEVILTADSHTETGISDDSRYTGRISRLMNSPALSVTPLINRLRDFYSNPKLQRCGWTPTSTKSKERYSRQKTSVPASQDTQPSLFDEGHFIPHPIFARKYCLIPFDKPLPQSMATNLMRTANYAFSHAMITRKGDASSSWGFRGPFTPQLGFDGGHDFEWDLVPAGSINTWEPNPASQCLRRRTSRPRSELKIAQKAASRPARDWFGLDAELPEPALCSPTVVSTRKRLSTHGYNWFGLD